MVVGWGRCGLGAQKSKRESVGQGDRAASVGAVDKGSLPSKSKGFHRRSSTLRIAFVALAGLGSVGSLVFERVTSDRLASAQVSDVRAVLAGLSAVGFLALGLQLSLVGWLGRFPGPRSLSSTSFDRAYVATSVAIGLTAGILAATFVESSSSYRLQIGALVALGVGASMISVPPRAELLNGEQWLRLGVLLLVSPAVRVLVGLVLLSSERSTVNIVPIAAGEVLAAAVAFALRPRHLPSAPASPAIRYVVNGAMASVGLLVTLVFSSIALRSRLGKSADIFNESALVARAVLFLPLTILFLYFPAIARSPLGSKELRRAFLSGLAWTTGLAMSVALTLILFPQQVGRVVVANDDPLSTSVIRLLAVAWALSSATIVSLLLYIAHGSRLSLTAWGAAIIITTGQIFATSALQLATAAVVASATLLIAVSIPAIIRVQPILHATTARPTGEQTMPRGDVALVIPCYNPGPSVVETVKAAHLHLTELGIRASIIVVCDGSTDGSADLIDLLDLPSLSQIRHPRNLGKGAALRTGFEHAHAEFIAFIDADGDLSPALLGSLLSAQQSFNADIVFGSKLHPDSEVHASGVRRLYSFGYQLMIRVLFQLDIRDTQTGIKVFRHQVIEAVLPCLNEDEFALDLELFIAARAAGFTNFVEVPVTLRRESGSTVSVHAIRRMFTDTLRLFWRAKIALAYTRFAAQPAQALPVESATVAITHS